MYWKALSEIVRHVEPPAGYRIAQLHSSEVDELVAGLRRWMPEAAEGGERCHLTPEFYRVKTQLVDVDEDRRLFPIVVKPGDAIVALFTLAKDRDDLSITWRMGIADPDHRGRGIGPLGPRFVELMGRAIGAELAYYFTTLRSPHQQVLSERAGFRLAGILPGSDRERMPDGSIKRVAEAMYVKSLTGDDDVMVPAPGALTERTRAVWESLFTRL